MIESQLFRALAVLRVIVLLNTLGLTLYRAVDRPGSFERPVGAAVGVAVMVVWTGGAIWAYASPPRRSHLLLGADLAVALGLLLATPLVKGPEFGASLPGFWVVGALLAWAIRYRTAGGLAAGVLLAAADLLVRPVVTQAVYGNAFLMVIGGSVVGFMCASLQQMAASRDLAERAAAASAERARLARVVHDGVLQTLAMVQRDPSAAGLRSMAAEQERSLRELMRDSTSAPRAGLVDLVDRLRSLESATVTVSTPGDPVSLPTGAVEELLGVVRECLANVAHHVGPDAAAYVFLHALPGELELSVRDEGAGIAPGRLTAAVAEGRLGVAQSIRGRISALGGTATLETGADGTEWTFRLPRTATVAP